MLQALYTPNARVMFHNLPAIVTPLPNRDICLSYETVSRPPTVITESQVFNYFGKQLHLVSNKIAAKNKLTLTLEEQLETERRAAYIDRLTQLSKTGGCGGVKLRQSVIDEVSRKLNDTKKVSPAQLARWHKKARTHSQGVAATVKGQRRQRRSNFCQDVIDLAMQAIDSYYLLPSKPTKQFAYDCFVDDLKEQLGEDVNYPSYVTFVHWIDAMVDPVDMVTRRQGKKAARAAKRNSLKNLVVDRIHQRAEADAVHLAVGLRDELGNYLGTATVFVVIDCFSRAVTGIQVQIGRGESAASVIDSFRHAITVKDPLSYSQEAVNDWPMYGSPEAFVVDGGPGYTAIETVAFCNDAESQVTVVDTGKGWKKPYVERFFSTLRNTFAKALPGYCGKYTDQRELDKNVEEQAVLTLAQFESALTHWIIDEYHQAPHKGLDGKTPHEVWQENALIFPPSLPANYDRIQYTKTETEKRTIHGENCHAGVVINYVHYNDDEGKLKSIGTQLRQLGEDPQVTCEYSPNDISSINVVDPFTDELFIAEAVDSRVTDGMTHAEFLAKYPPKKSNKGYGRPRSTAINKDIAQAKAEHKERMKHNSKRSSEANTDEISDVVNRNRQDEADKPTGQSGNSTSEEMSSRNQASFDSNKECPYE